MGYSTMWESHRRILGSRAYCVIISGISEINAIQVMIMRSCQTSMQNGNSTAHLGALRSCVCWALLLAYTQGDRGVARG